MILPFIVGYLAGKSYGKNKKVIFVSLIVGLIMGICGGLELIPFAYPLYATRPLDWMGLPEYRPIAFYLAGPYFKLYQEVVLMTEISIFTIVVFTVVCALGVILGYAYGNRTYKIKDDLWLVNQQ